VKIAVWKVEASHNYARIVLHGLSNVYIFFFCRLPKIMILYDLKYFITFATLHFIIGGQHKVSKNIITNGLKLFVREII